MTSPRVKAPEEAWPPECCVPAFIHRALREVGVHPPSPQEIARRLDVRVMATTPNPFNLALTDNPKEMGTTPKRARIDALLSSHAPHLGFRHIPFATVTFGLFEEVGRQALERGCHVGVGVDPVSLGIGTPPGLRHVLRLNSLRAQECILVDDSCDSCTDLKCNWETLERAILAVDDGYWVIGAHDALALDNCLPYRGRVQA